MFNGKSYEWEGWRKKGFCVGGGELGGWWKSLVLSGIYEQRGISWDLWIWGMFFSVIFGSYEMTDGWVWWLLLIMKGECKEISGKNLEEYEIW